MFRWIQRKFRSVMCDCPECGGKGRVQVLHSNGLDWLHEKCGVCQGKGRISKTSCRDFLQTWKNAKKSRENYEKTKERDAELIRGRDEVDIVATLRNYRGILSAVAKRCGWDRLTEE